MLQSERAAPGNHYHARRTIMTRMSRSNSAAKATLLFSGILLCATSAVGQRGGTAANGGSITPERSQSEKSLNRRITPPKAGEKCDPDKIFDSCPWSYTLKYSVGAGTSSRHGGAETARSGFAFSVYLTHRLNVEIDNDNFVTSKTKTNPRKTGVGDTTIYIGDDLLVEEKDKSRPAISISYGIKLPTASAAKGLGSGEVDHTFSGSVIKTFQEKNRLEFDVGDNMAGRTNTTGFDHFPFAGGSFERALGEKRKYTLHFEVGGDFATSKAHADMYSLDYLRTKLPHHLSLKTGMRFGLTPNVSRAGLFVGISYSGQIK